MNLPIQSFPGNGSERKRLLKDDFHDTPSCPVQQYYTSKMRKSLRLFVTVHGQENVTNPFSLAADVHAVHVNWRPSAFSP